MRRSTRSSSGSRSPELRPGLSLYAAVRQDDVRRRIREASRIPSLDLDGYDPFEMPISRSRSAGRGAREVEAREHALHAAVLHDEHAASARGVSVGRSAMERRPDVEAEHRVAHHLFELRVPG